MFQDISIANSFAKQIAQIDDRAKFQKYLKKIIIIRAPINHGAGHWRAFALAISIFKKFKACVIKKAGCRRASPYIFFPVTGISSNRNQGQHL